MKKGKNPGVLVVPTSAVGLQPQMEETSEAYRVQILTPGMSTAHIIRLGLIGEGNGNPLQFLPGESQGWRSLVGCCLWGRTESDLTEAT